MNLFRALISLDRGRRFLLANPEMAPWDFKIFGERGADLPAGQYFAEMFSSEHVVLSPSEVGARISHMRALSSFLQSDREHCLVLEDDVYVDCHRLRKLTNDLNADFDFYHLGGLDGLRVSSIFGKLNGLDHPTKLSKTQVAVLWRACGYLVNRRAAESILLAQATSVLVADNWARLICSGNITAAYYHCVSHPEVLTESSIEGERLSLEKLRSYAWIKNFSRRIRTVKALYLSRWFS